MTGTGGLSKLRKDLNKAEFFQTGAWGSGPISKDELAPIVGYRDLNNFRVNPESKEMHPALILLNTFIRGNKVF
jgi:hypothetical protein